MRQRSLSRRREFLKRSGAVGATAAVTGLAGCLGDDDDDDDTDDTGTTDDSDDGTTDDTDDTDDGDDSDVERHIDIAINPATWTQVLTNYVQDEGILEEEMDEVDYTYDLDMTWDDVTLFAAGQVDMASMGATETAFMAMERDLDLTFHGKYMAGYGGIGVRRDGEFATSETGGVQESMDKLAEEGNWGTGGWEGGNVKIFRVLFPEVFDLQFREEGGDFDVIVADYAVQPQLIMDDEIDAGDTLPSLGAIEYFYDRDPSDIEILFWVPDLMTDNGYNANAYGGIVTRTDFAEQHGDAVEAFTRAMQRAVDWVYDDPVDAFQQSGDAFGIDDPDQLAWLAEHGILNERAGLNTPNIYEHVPLTDEWIDQERDFLSRSVEEDDLDAGWEERVTFNQIDL